MANGKKAKKITDVKVKCDKCGKTKKIRITVQEAKELPGWDMG